MMAGHISVRISASDWALLKSGLFTDDKNENAAAMLCGVAATKFDTRLLVRKVLPVSMSEYRDRTGFHLEVAPSFYNRIVDEALREGLNLLIVHSHPFPGEARYSVSDDYGESRLLPVLRSLLPGSIVASLLLTETASSGRFLAEKNFIPLHSLTIVGRRIQTISFVQERTVTKNEQEVFDRQVRAFGGAGQRILEKLRVAVVGVGGTGSIVAEQLARAGIRDFLLVDPDIIEESNVSRLFGSYLTDINSKKVEVVASHLRELGAKNVDAVADTAIRQPIQMLLRNRDIVFGCVDNDLSRSILNRFAYQYLIPVIDVGIRLDGRTGDIRAAAGRVSVVGPSMLCLRCSQHMNSARIRAESLPVQERRRLEREGYVMGIDEPAPAVVSFNVSIGGLAVTAALNLFVNLTGGVQPLDQLYDATAGIVFAVGERHDQGCDICDASIGIKALGDKQIVSAYT